MTAPASSLTPAHTHPCARCGAPVGIDVGLCDRCNPLGLKDSASSQVHGTAILAVGVAIATLAIVARLLIAGIGPFSAAVTAMRPAAATGSFVATLTVHNDGSTIGSATCRLTDPSDPALLHVAVVYSPRIPPGETITFEQEVPFGSADLPPTVTCRGP